MEYNFVTKTAKRQKPVDFKKLSLVLNNLMELFPTVASMPKYASSMASVSGRLQSELWEIYSTTALDDLRETLDDDLWIGGRRAWLKLDQWTKTKRVSNQIFKSTGFSRVRVNRRKVA